MPSGKSRRNHEGLELKDKHQLLVSVDEVNMLGEKTNTIKETHIILPVFLYKCESWTLTLQV
jgi:hypothetical protein